LNNELLLNELEELAGKLGIAIRYENVNGEDSSGSGGLCRLKGEYVLIIHTQATVQEKIRRYNAYGRLIVPEKPSKG